MVAFHKRRITLQGCIAVVKRFLVLFELEMAFCRSGGIHDFERSRRHLQLPSFNFALTGPIAQEARLIHGRRTPALERFKRFCVHLGRVPVLLSPKVSIAWSRGKERCGAVKEAKSWFSIVNETGEARARPNLRFSAG
jgi:hypothetical protein